MKTKILILVFTGLSFAFLLNAQLSPGIKGGVNFANLIGYNGEARVGIHAGLFLHHKINSRWCLQPEILYSSEGQRYFNDEERVLSLDYVQIPLMVQYYLTRQFYLEAGPQLGLLASAKDYPVDNGIKLNVKDEFTSTQVGINVGIGVQANHTLGFYGRYNIGLTDISRYDNIIDQSRVGQLGMTIRLK
jgi:hypothetical protein